jgi:hypothetical protein
VTTKTDATPTLDDCGIQCMVVGYAGQHDTEENRIWNPLGCKFHVTPNIMWRSQILFTKKVDESRDLA